MTKPDLGSPEGQTAEEIAAAAAVENGGSSAPADPNSENGGGTDSPDLSKADPEGDGSAPAGDAAFDGAVSARFDEVQEGLGTFDTSSIDKLLEANPKVRDAVVEKLGIEGVKTADEYVAHAANKALDPLVEGLSKFNPESIASLKSMDSRLVESLVKSGAITVEGKPAESVEKLFEYFTDGDGAGDGSGGAGEITAESEVAKIDDIAKGLEVTLTDDQRGAVETSVKESFQKFVGAGGDPTKFSDVFDVAAQIRAETFDSAKKSSYEEGVQAKVDIQRGQQVVVENASETPASTTSSLLTQDEFNAKSPADRTAYIGRYGSNFRTS